MEIGDDLYIGGSADSAGGIGNLSVVNHGAVSVGTELRVWQSGTVEVGPQGVISVGDSSVTPSPGNITVGPGGTLSGSGMIDGDVEILGGTLSPGNSPGMLSIDGDVLVATGSHLQLELAGTTRGLYDELHVTGNLSISGMIEVLVLDGFSPQAGDRFTFFDVQGSLDLTNASFILPSGLAFKAVAPGEFEVRPVPEPGSITIILLAVCLLGVRRKLCASA